VSLVKTVEMRVLADAGDAQAKLDDLDAKAKSLDGDAIKMRFRVDDAAGKAQLDDLRAQADRLGLKDVDIKVKVDGAGRATAELAAVRAEVDEASRGGGLLSRLFGGGPPLSGAGSLGGGIPVLGSLFGPAGLAIVPAIEAALPEVTGLVSGFAAAGAGAGAFAALAVPAVKKVQAAYSSLNSAQSKYQSAKALYKLDPTSGNKSALVTAAAHYTIAQEAMKKLSPDEQGAIKGIQGLTREYGKMSKAFEPQAFRVFNNALKVARNLLPALTPFANTFATSLDGLLKRADKFTQSKGFSQFLNQFRKIEGPAITSIGTGIGNVANSVGKLMTTMSGKDVARTIGMAFNGIAATIGGVAAVVAHLMSSWDTLSDTAKRDTHQVAAAFDALNGDIGSAVKGAAHGFASAWDGLVSDAKSVEHGVLSYFGMLGSGVSVAVKTVESDVGKLPSQIEHVFSGAGGWLVSAGKAIMSGFLSGIESGWHAVASFVGGIGSWIAAHKGPLSVDAVLLQPAGTQIMAGLLKGITSGMPAVKAKVVSIAASIVTDLQGGQSAITAAAKAAGNAVAGPDASISGAITKLKADVKGNTGLTKWLEAENVKLQGLAAKRAALEQEIADSQQIAQAALQNSSIMNAGGYTPAMDANGPTAASSTIAGMQAMAADQAKFAAQVNQLKKMGLNATSLNQIVQSGVSSGLPVAEGLTSGGKAGIGQINKLQSQIQASAAKLGDAGAQSMYQAGVQAGQGLAEGIKSQLSAVNAAISGLANSLVAQIKKDLHIKSPCRVGRDIGANLGGSVGLGVTDMIGSAVNSARQFTSALVGGFGASSRGGAPGAAAAGGDTYHVYVNGIITNPQDTGRQLVQVLKEYKRNGGGAALGIA
jgi:hypothetical protein